MNTEKLTQKTIEALRGAQNAATENGNPSVEEEHLLYALLTQPDGLVGEVMRSVGAVSYTHLRAYPLRRQRQMCIRDRSERSCAAWALLPRT